MIETIGTETLTDTHEHVILISHDSSRARLGWISASTGLTYCGICLRSSVTPESGSVCPSCRARVAYVFDFSASPEAMRHAWREVSLRRSAEPHPSNGSYTGEAESDFGETAAPELVTTGGGSIEGR